MQATGVRRIAIIAGAALGLLLLAEAGIRWRAPALPDPLIWSGPEMQYKERQIRRLQASGGASVVFLGSSVVDAGVDPSSMSLATRRPVYNAGTGGASLGMIDLWARRVVVPRLRPDVVVLGLASRELNPHDPEQARLERDFFESRAVKRLDNGERLLQRVERTAEGWSSLFRYRTVLRQPRFLSKALGLGSAPGRDGYRALVADDGQHKRFLHLTFTGDPHVGRVLANRELRNYEVGHRQLSTARGLISFLERQASHVIVVNMPETPTWLSLHPRGEADHEAFVAAIRALAASAEVRFIDGGVWQEDLFADPAHLNGKGARRLSALLEEELRRLGPL